MNTSIQPKLVGEFTVSIEQLQDYEFKVRFDKPQFPEWRR
jgi:hypothetical protein